MKTKLLLFCGVIFLILQNSCVSDQKIEREIQFDNDWKFIRADITGAEQSSFDDSDWRILDLPHDYSIEDLPEKEGIFQIGPFSEESAGGASTGHVMGGTAWYRKHFTLKKEDEGKIIKIVFDGVYMNSDVWINGQHLGNQPYGYSPFSFDLSDYLNPVGEENVLAVQVKNEGKNSRWYSGSGIYRNVTLVKVNPIHIALWGNYITTPDISDERAVVKIETGILNTTVDDHKISLSTIIQDQNGETVASLNGSLVLNSGKKNTNQRELEISMPQLWSVDSPNLYTAITQLKKGNKILDETKTKFGIRSIEFSAEKGFLLNGESVLLKGGCLHHDNGILGSAAFKTAEYRRVQTMKNNGFNAIRTAHNPPSAFFLDACDELGMLVMDESFDQWQRPKNPEDYNLYFDDWWEKDLEAMVLRDRNHPSIIMWSIGNEIGERADSSGLVIAKFLKEKVLSMDDTRPVTQAICLFWDNPGKTWDYSIPAFAQMDLGGYNYQWSQYEPDHQKFPERIIVGTESFPKEAFENWDMVEKHPYIIGDFVWTGMDYLGESGIGHNKLDNSDIGFLPPWPWYNAYCGDISILGYKKPQMYYRDVVWRNSDLEMLVHAPVPKGRKEMVSMWGWPEETKSWNWQGNEGTVLQVSLYSRCDEVRLELNGELIGTQKISEEFNPVQQMDNPGISRGIDALAAHFEVPYQAGELLAIGFKDGKEFTRQTLKTTGKPARIKLTAESETIPANPNELAYFNVEVLDENGLLVPDAEIPIEFNIRGKCKMQAVGNGNPKDMKSFHQPNVNSFRGRCQLIVRSCEEGDQIVVTAKSAGLETATCTVLLN